ncbi:MAG: flagellar basal body rod protein FlgC [Desulfobacterales bacterium]|nr:flagellar basal body rod protein FlgC [Desulfobacterales bacterium]MBF0397502.1 flagellar basal body rod protein FlgC [Desulfobacterales bacterium]
MDFIHALKISATGLTANRTKMNVIAENLANVETTRTQEGGPYKRKMVIFEENNIEDFSKTMDEVAKKSTGVKVSEVAFSQEDYTLVYNPSHPDANASGYVAMPNVNMLTEITDMIVARRAYDANASALSNTKSMILKALEIGK